MQSTFSGFSVTGYGIKSSTLNEIHMGFSADSCSQPQKLSPTHPLGTDEGHGRRCERKGVFSHLFHTKGSSKLLNSFHRHHDFS